MRSVDLDSLILFYKDGTLLHRSERCAGYRPDDAALEVYGRAFDFADIRMTTFGEMDPDPDDLCPNCAGWIQDYMRE